MKQAEFEQFVEAEGKDILRFCRILTASQRQALEGDPESGCDRLQRRIHGWLQRIHECITFCKNRVEYADSRR